MRNTRKVIVTLLVLMTILVSLAAVAIPASAASVRISGSFNGWGTASNTTLVDGLYCYKVNLTKGSQYEFKVVVGSSWLGNGGTISDTTITSTYNAGWDFKSSDGSNCKLKATTGGTYIFQWNDTTKKLNVFPHSSHDLSTVINAATCTANGSATHTCKVAGCGYTSTETLQATGHSYVDGACSVCGEAEPAEHVHFFVESITKDATCTEEGIKSFDCACGEDGYTEAIPVIAHSYNYGHCTACDAANPDYTFYIEGYINNADYTGTKYAFANGELTIPAFSATSYIYLTDSEGHKFMTPAYSTATSATFTTTGAEKMLIPTGFDEIKFTVVNNKNGSVVLSYEGISACDHKWVDATCQLAKHCSVCEEKDGNVINHYYVDGACVWCTATISEWTTVYVDNAAGWETVYFYAWSTTESVGTYHAWPGKTMTLGEDGLWFAQIPAGYENVIFSHDGGQSADLKVPTDGENVVYNNSSSAWGKLPHVHSWSDATCTEPQKCECGESQGEALGHSYSAVVTAPDCVNGGYTTYTCACGDTYTADETAALGHSFAEGTCSACGAADPDYVAPEEPTDVKPIVNVSDLATGTTTDAELIAGTGIYASAGLTIEPNGKEVDGFSFTNRLKLGGTMKVEDGIVKAAVRVDTTGAAKIVIYCMSSSSSADRVLQIATLSDGALSVLNSIEGVGGTALAKYEFNVTEAGTYYIGSKSSGINVYYVAVEPITEAPHEHNYSAAVTAPTCTTAGYTTYTCECGDSYTAEETAATGHYYVLDICYFCYDVKPSLVLGDNTVVVPESGSAFGMIYIAEAGTYQVTDASGAIVCIFTESIFAETSDFSIAADGTLGASWNKFSLVPAELQPGFYYVGVYGAGEHTVNLSTYTAPVEEKWTFWLSDGTLYTVDGYNIKYNGAGNTYACVGTADVAPLAVGNNTFTVTITNNGTVDSRVRVDIQGTNQVGNHKVCNVSAVGGDVWTDMDWGGSIVTVPAGQSVTLVITYDAEGQYGAVTNLIFFVDAMRGDEATYSADITVSDMAFYTPHVNSLVVGDTNKIVVSGDYLNDWNLPIEWVPFVADESAYYSFVGDKGALAYIFTADGGLVSATGAANLEAGNYLICVGNGLVGEFNVAVTKSAWVNALAVGDNKILITDALDNGAGYYIVWVPFEVTEKDNYTFGGEGILALVYDSAYAAVSGTELDVGTYNVCIAFLTPTTTGVANVSVVKGAGDEPAPELPALVLGDNTVVIDGSQVNLTGNAVAWYTFTPEEAGVYQFSCSDITIYILTSQNMADLNAYIGAGGIAELEEGVQYFVLVGKEGVKGEFTVNAEKLGDDVELPAVNTLVVGDNKYVLNGALKDIGHEWLYITVDQDGVYTFSGLSTLQFYIWADYPDQATVPETAKYVMNVDPITLDFVDSIDVELVAGTYLVGFRFDYVEGIGEFDINVSRKGDIPHKHNFVDGECECGEIDPDTPVEPKPEVELNFFQKILKTITEFFAKIGVWFKNLFAKK